MSSTTMCLCFKFCFVGSESFTALHIKCQILLGARIFQSPFHTAVDPSDEDELELVYVVVLDGIR